MQITEIINKSYILLYRNYIIFVIFVLILLCICYFTPLELNNYPINYQNNYPQNYMR